MLKKRVIPCLLLRGAGLVKTVRFKDPKYVGDPINAIRIFNDKEVDELVLLDITATREGRGPSFSVIEEVASECFMPLAYGGGIRTVEEARRILKLGVEKIVLNTIAWRDVAVLTAASEEFGAQAIVASIDVRRGMLGKYEVVVESAAKRTGVDPVTYARRLEAAGAGEILLTSVDRDGTMQGYDVDLIARVSAAVQVPVIASAERDRCTTFGSPPTKAAPRRSRPAQCSSSTARIALSSSRIRAAPSWKLRCREESIDPRHYRGRCDRVARGPGRGVPRHRGHRRAGTAERLPVLRFLDDVPRGGARRNRSRVAWRRHQHLGQLSRSADRHSARGRQLLRYPRPQLGAARVQCRQSGTVAST
jgi:cyclase